MPNPINSNNSDPPIAALATAIGEAAVTILRLSGPNTFTVVDRMVRSAGLPPSQRAAGTFFHANIYNPLNNSKLDDGLVLIFRAPHSYTGEDAVEIQGHGGTLVAKQLLEAALQAGARLAEPGEFTRRAFLNGRLDLTQAEAVADLIRARSSRSLAAARAQLDGNLGIQINDLYEQLTILGSELENVLDLEEGDLTATFIAQQVNRTQTCIALTDKLLSTWHEGHLLRQGALAVIAGQPNVGKSSLMNALLGQARAIVTAQAGTTRDTIEEGLIIDGYHLRLVDTAGLRSTECEAEQLGIERTRKIIGQADIVMLVLDGSEPLQYAELLKETKDLKSDHLIAVINKHDLPVKVTTEQLKPYLPTGTPILPISAKTGYGLGELKAQLITLLGIHPDADNAAARTAIAERHFVALQTARSDVISALKILQENIDGNDIPLVAHHIRAAAEETGRVLGRTYTEDLLDTIFARFCVGK